MVVHKHTHHSVFFSHGFLIPTSCLLFWVLCNSKVGTGFLRASHYQPKHTQREGTAQRDRLRWQRQPFLSTQPHVLCQAVIQLAASTFLSKPTRDKGCGAVAQAYTGRFSIYGFFYPAPQTQEWLVAVTPIWQNKWWKQTFLKTINHFHTTNTSKHGRPNI